ncbi:MAG: hypothetical protein AAF086_03295 [Planctomycetota bacterium]
MLFKATLIAVIVYLAACYAYGLYLLVKLYTNKRLHAAPANLQENPRSLRDTADAPAAATGPDAPAYEAPAKAA